MQNLIFCAVLENQKAGENKGFVFITALEHVYIKFIKINRIEFNRKEITIQSVTSTRLQTNVTFKNAKRPQVVVYRHPEN